MPRSASIYPEVAVGMGEVDSEHLPNTAPLAMQVGAVGGKVRIVHCCNRPVSRRKRAAGVVQ